MNETETFQWKVSGMSCNGCKMSIEKALGKLGGVAKVAVNFSATTLEVEIDSARLQPADIEKVVADLGFQLEKDMNAARNYLET